MEAEQMQAELVFIWGHALHGVELSPAECTPVHSHSGLSVGRRCIFLSTLTFQHISALSVHSPQPQSPSFFPSNPSIICHFKPSLSLSPGASCSIIKIGLLLLSTKHGSEQMLRNMSPAPYSDAQSLVVSHLHGLLTLSCGSLYLQVLWNF